MNTSRIAHAKASPLTPAVFHILLALADGRKHGYAILKQVNAEGGQSLRMGPGTLYGSLQRMEASGLVQEFEDASDERRRFYELTDSGRRALTHELERMREVLTAATRKGLASWSPIQASRTFR